VLKYEYGEVYDGDWKEDSRVGKGNLDIHLLGSYIYNNGDIYDGEWLNDKKHGKGMK